MKGMYDEPTHSRRRSGFLFAAEAEKRSDDLIVMSEEFHDSKS